MITIELDCPPGAPRPDGLLPGVLENTGLTVEDFENTSRFFGNWIYKLKDGKEEAYAIAKPTIKERVKALYYSGAIRYGSW